MKREYILLVFLVFSFACISINRTNDPDIFVSPAQTNLPQKSTDQPTKLIEPSPTQFFTPTPAGPQILWEDEFNNLSQWRINIDKSVGCENFSIGQEDIKFQIIKDETSLGLDSNVLQLEANSMNKGGLFVNAIASREFEFFDNSIYQLSGYFRIAEHTKAEIIDAAIEFVIDGVGHYAELFYGLNPYTDYGWIYTRSQDLQPIRLVKIGVDYEWHYFELIVSVNFQNELYEINKIVVDGFEKFIDVQMPSFQKPWFSSTQVYLETHNQYTNCNINIITKGVSRWDQITIVRLGTLGEQK